MNKVDLAHGLSAAFDVHQRGEQHATVTDRTSALKLASKPLRRR